MKGKTEIADTGGIDTLIPTPGRDPGRGPTEEDPQGIERGGGTPEIGTEDAGVPMTPKIPGIGIDREEIAQETRIGEEGETGETALGIRIEEGRILKKE